MIVISDVEGHDTPDSIFPNNWISFHESGTVGLYPMFAENRRLERREDILDHLEAEGFLIKNVVDYTAAEKENILIILSIYKYHLLFLAFSNIAHAFEFNQ